MDQSIVGVHGPGVSPFGLRSRRNKDFKLPLLTFLSTVGNKIHALN